MVIRKNLKKKYALLSVYNKNNLKYLCEVLKNYGYNLISTGSTAAYIKKVGFECTNISKITNFKEIMDGRVKTLNPKIYGSILHIRNNKKHVNDFKKLNVPKIDIVVINLYPFQKYIKTFIENDIIEMIDIGGPSLLRAAAKNYKYITPISNITDYKSLTRNLKKNEGITDINFRKKMASKVFSLTSSYDNRIKNWFQRKNEHKKNLKLRYGENPSQKAYLDNGNKKNIFEYQIHGKQISYNNIIDVDSGLKCLMEFNDPTSVIIKHSNPCGVASSSNIYQSFIKSYESDKISAFGGIILVNRKINKKLAYEIVKNFFEVVVAPDFDVEGLTILKGKKNLILLKMGRIRQEKWEHRSTIFGNLYQTKDIENINKKYLKLVSSKKADGRKIDDLIFALKVTRHLKSNAIVLVKNKQVMGVGCGQTNRIDSLKQALKRLKENFDVKNFVCASDGFFPFTDSIKELKKNKCNIIAQPSGSINDTTIIEYAKKNKLSLYFIKNRLFKH